MSDEAAGYEVRLADPDAAYSCRCGWVGGLRDLREVPPRVIDGELICSPHRCPACGNDALHVSRQAETPAKQGGARR